MPDCVAVVTGTRKGIGRTIAQHLLARGAVVYGVSRQASELEHSSYRHTCLDVADEGAVRSLFAWLRKSEKRLDVLVCNAGVASMNHALLTPGSAVERLLATNVTGTFLFAREAAKIMQARKYGRIVTMGTVATPLKLEGEAAYAASKAAVVSLTQVLAREFAQMGITVNAIGPTPIRTDLVAGVPEHKLQALIERQAIKRFGEVSDVLNALDFFVRPESDFITGQVLYLGGI